jgi:uncharacterized phage protein (TIGR01671 family)
LLTVFRTEEREGGILLWRLIMIPKFRAWLKESEFSSILDNTLTSHRVPVGMYEPIILFLEKILNENVRNSALLYVKDDEAIDGFKEVLAYNKHIDVMMSTGMKDVNGKEIYEGDIVRCTVYDGKSMGGYYGGLVEAEGVVEYDFEKAAFVVEGITLSILVEEEEDARTYLEVLGNKYENPELLEKIK